MGSVSFTAAHSPAFHSSHLTFSFSSVFAEISRGVFSRRLILSFDENKQQTDWQNPFMQCLRWVCDSSLIADEFLLPVASLEIKRKERTRMKSDNLCRVGKVFCSGVACSLMICTLSWPVMTAAQTVLPTGASQAFAISNATVSTQSAQTVAAERPLSLTDLEQMALQNNPTLAQAEAAIRAAEGRQVQAGLMPNPIVGYAGEELAFRALGEKSEHLGFIEQTIPLGGKLRKSRQIFAQEKLQTEQDAAAQRQRILNGVQMLYYRALGAEQLIEVRTQLARLAREAVKITSELYNVGQADRPDAAQIRIEAQRAELDLMMAENARDQVWQELAAVTGNPFLKSAPLIGEIEKGLPALDQAALLNQLLASSPEIKRAQAGVERARASVSRAKAEVAPDLFVRGGIGYNRELLEKEIPGARRTGPEAQVEIGLRIPLWNRNQGGIATAGAELEMAEREVRRVELLLRARFASSFRNYLNALRVATRYEQQIVPEAQNAYDTYLRNFRGMAAAYPQVLIAQRTLFQVRAEYVEALVNAWQNAVLLRGYLLNGALDAPGSISAESGSTTGADDRD
jgi:cobalt-zinc-cadmium efflux system outer membrane protein